MPGGEQLSPDIYCTSVGMGCESWFSTCAGCVHCLGSTESVKLVSANSQALLLRWDPGLRRRGPSAQNLAYICSRISTERTLVNSHMEFWDDPVRAAMLRVTADHNIDPDAVKAPIQPIYGKEGLADAYNMWTRMGHVGWDRLTFARHHQSLGFYWSRAFPDTTRVRFSFNMIYNDPIAPAKKHSIDITGQLIGRHNVTHLLRGRDEHEETPRESGGENSNENSS
ncbi:hypothetical protein DHEL01_v205162 [Diaporthe helianthi]|uniref:Uncharacterized protein n=1 Tax=Diaporthe helianthi TaxID=158607 RepID=A0A2P5I1R0_DIAHE|nr:hypothetical protein DHEL01_v205162 [Diaporthe helianthi]